MPVRPPTRCRQCRRLHPGRGLCPACKKDRYVDRRWIYSSQAWADLRDQVLSEEPLCADCRGAPPVDIDHRIPITVAPHLALVRTNVHGLCKPCHGRKTRREG